MASEEKPGWFGRLFGRKGQDAAEEKPDDKPEADLPAEAASPSEGQPDFATGAADVETIPLPPEETGEPVADVVEGADLLPIVGEPERPPAVRPATTPPTAPIRSIPGMRTATR